MALENGTYVNSLVTTNPASTDGIAQADDHIRLIKSTIKNTFPNLNGAVTATVAQLNSTASMPSSLTDLSISDGSANQVLQTDGSGNFSFVSLPAGTTDTNYYVTGGSVSGTTLTLTRSGLGNVSISGLPAAVTATSQLTNNSGFITSQYSPPTSAGAVGTYAFLSRPDNSGPSPVIVQGSSYAGSGLRYTVVSSTNDWNYNTALGVSSSASGTWRAMGASGTAGGTTHSVATVFLRIA